ncbi:hypothetical protein HK097_000631 [Rhizophlyctis rosea]|uniref:Methyltransferase domain-containing protein n=1 Tax=Rhizophlyctis rosea TaxID=64517 RepID=A0AAD5S7V2_9FUNG|nr:hypothetical protein HK097_000631 [Rhizophlyctis rosea]
MGICYSSKPKPRDVPIVSVQKQHDTLEPARPRADSFKYDASGRRLHADCTPLSEDAVASDKLYVLPNDDEEMERLHMQHYIVRLLFGGNYSAPVTKRLEAPGAKALDLGCGSGIWAFETATDFPQAEVTGFDISPVQPGTVKRKNANFIVGDLTYLPLPFEDENFDFVYMRFLITGLRKEFWPVLIKEIIRIVKPGGYIELMEFANPAMQGPTKVPNLVAFMAQGVMARGGDPDISRKLKDYLASSPETTEVNEVTKPLPTCPHPSDTKAVRLARMYGDDVTGVLMGVGAALIAKGVCTEEQYPGLVRAHVEEMLATDHTVYWTRAFARKHGGLEE